VRQRPSRRNTRGWPANKLKALLLVRTAQPESMAVHASKFDHRVHRPSRNHLHDLPNLK
jgi:hypothetical protein